MHQPRDMSKASAPLPPETEPAYPLRLAHSYAEYARNQLDECEQAHTAKRIDDARHRSVRGFYENHLRKAQAILESLRADERQRLQRIETLISSIASRQSDLAGQVARGRLDADSANDQNRRQQAELNDLRRQAQRSRAQLNAGNAEALGGFIRLSLDEYELKFKQQAPRPKARKSSIGIVVGIAVIGILAGLAIGVFGLLPGAGSLNAKIAWTNAGDQLIDVTCENESAEAAELYVPWPDGSGRELPDGADSGTTYGIQLHVREQGSSEFRLLPVSEGCWLYKGGPILGQGPVVIHPGLSATVTLDTAKLVGAGVSADAVRIAVTARNGRAIETWEGVISPGGTRSSASGL